MKTYSIEDIEKKGYGVENNIIKSIDINIIGHFGNIPCLTIMCENIMPYGHYNDIARLGFLLKELVEFFGVDREDGVLLSELKNIPCRIVYNGNGKSHWGDKAIGIGHYMKDKFILFEDFPSSTTQPRKAVRKMAEWIKVSERLPEADTEVLAYCTELKHKVQVLTFDEHKLWLDYYGQNGRAKYWGITHWQPLPPPPEVEK